MALLHPVIVVPGITASELRDEYAVTPETVPSVAAANWDPPLRGIERKE